MSQAAALDTPKSSKQRNIILNISSLSLLFLFMWWADGSMTTATGWTWLPGKLNGYIVQILNLVAVYGILALGLNLIYGFTGMFSLGHAGFMAIGAYVSALCVLPAAQKEIMWLLKPMMWPFSVLSTPFWVSIILGGLCAAFIALLIGIPVLRLGGDYLGIATLGLAEIIRVLIVNMVPITNGALGIKGIPSHVSLLTSYIWLFIILCGIIKLMNSNFGNVLKAVRDDGVAAQVMGINVFATKLFSFCLGAFLAGVGGALLGNLLTTIDPKMFNFQLTFNILMIVVAGGLGSITGSIIGAVLITVLLEWLRFVESPLSIAGIHIPGIPGMRMVVFSVCLLLIILYRREGIMGMREISWNGLFALPGRIRNKLTKKTASQPLKPTSEPNTKPSADKEDLV